MPLETRLEAIGGPVPRAVDELRPDVVALPVRPGPEVVPGDRGDAAGFEPLPGLGLAELLAFQQAKGEPGELVAAPVSLGGRVAELLLYGVGDGTPGALRKAGAALTRRAKGRDAMVVAAPPGDLTAFAEGVLLAGYGFRIGEPPKKGPVGTVTVITDDEGRAALERGAAFARATAFARDLANTPAAEKNPAWLADRAAELAAEAGLTIRVRDEKDLGDEGFGGLLAVGAGSITPPRLIELSYEPAEAAAGAEHVVLVGKGITFDTGGLSLKPTDNMVLMKTDMSGGAVVMAVMSALRTLGVGVRVTGLIPTAENMFSGSAMRPQDVITHYGGKTSEVLNTDAEGRLVLADALAYADATLDPDLIVDVATLTGAARVALGSRTGALFATDDALAGELSEAGAAAGEPVWRLPLVDDYRQAIDSDVADIANIGRGGFGGGSITAALFLREFVGERRWAHLDIAGPGRSTADDGELSKGATGFSARLLLHWLTTTA